MGKMIEFTRPDGQKVPGYLAEPAGGQEAPGVVVIQEWWGLRAPKSHITELCDRLAAAGFRALAPDLYRGKEADDAESAQKLMESLDWGGAVADIQGALSYLKQSGKKAAVWGFCLGGALSVIAAAKLPEANAAVCYYGIPPAEAADPATIKIPFLGHFATDDDWCNTQAVEKLEERLKAGNVPYTLHTYEGKHAFFNDHRPDVYNAEAASTSWERSLEFLKKNLA